MSKKSVLIIGSGIAGIAASIRLAQAGFEVTVIEVNSYPGGKLSSVSALGYRFDAGPSLFTLPHLVDDLFQLCGKNPKDYFNYLKLDTLCKYFYEDGKEITAFADLKKFAEELDLKCGEPRESTLSFLDESKRVYEITEPVFLKHSLHKLKTYLRSTTIKAIPKLPSLHMFDTMAAYNQHHFKSKYVAQLFNRYATYNGSDPYQAPATLNLIPHLEFNLGAYLPVGGMIAIADALYELAKEMRVHFVFNERVTKILTQHNRTKGVQTNKSEYPSDIVISNMDVYPTYHKLLSDKPKPHRVLNQPRSGSALIFYWGVKREFPQLDVHNIFFSGDYKKEFEAITIQKTVGNDPTVYVNITSKKIKKDAPQNCENWFVLINVPPNTGQDWDTIIAHTRKNVLNKLSRLLNEDVESLLNYESILDPRSIELKTSSYQGALYGSSSNNRMAAFFRHKNFSSDIKGLYFCGGSVHPGGGIPLCLMGAAISSDLVMQDFA